MPHAMFVVAEVVPGRREESLTSLREHTIPWVTTRPGFLRGTWFGDDDLGHGLVLFATEQDARDASGMVRAGPDDPVRIRSVTVYEVNAEAAPET